MKRKIAAAVGVGVGAIQRVAARSRLEAGHDLDAAMRREYELGVATLSSSDFVAGVARFTAGEAQSDDLTLIAISRNK